jgi:3-dehydroquinate synthase
MTQTLSHETVRVDLGERSYDIVIGPGLIARAGAEIAARKPGIRCAVITDRNVAATHLDRLMESLAADGSRQRRWCWNRVRKPSGSTS